MTRRAVSPVLGVVLLVAVTIVAAVAVGAAAPELSKPPPQAALSLSVSGPAIALTHEGGAPLAVADLRIRVRVDGDPLANQPPIPFFAASGFVSGPEGPFNSADDGEWTAGETARVTVAGTNDPVPAPGDTVRVLVAVDGAPVADLSGTA